MNKTIKLPVNWGSSFEEILKGKYYYPNHVTVVVFNGDEKKNIFKVSGYQIEFERIDNIEQIYPATAFGAYLKVTTTDGAIYEASYMFVLGDWIKWAKQNKVKFSFVNNP